MGSHEGNSLEPVRQTNSSLRAAPWEAEGVYNPLQGAATSPKLRGSCREEGAHLASMEDKNEKGLCVHL